MKEIPSLSKDKRFILTFFYVEQLEGVDWKLFTLGEN